MARRPVPRSDVTPPRPRPLVHAAAGVDLLFGPWTLPSMSVVVGGWAASMMALPYVGLYGGVCAAAVATISGSLMNWRARTRDEEHELPGPERQELLAWGQGYWPSGAVRARATTPMPQYLRAGTPVAEGGELDQQNSGGGERDQIWRKANAIRNDLRAAQAEYEFDLAEKLFRRPLLSDVDEPTTATWLEALENMDLLMPDEPPSTIEVARTCLQAAEHALAAWKAADKRARDIGLGQLSDADARRLGHAQKLLTAALDRGTADAERRVQVAKIVEILTVITGRSTAAVGAEVQQAVNCKLLSIGAPPLRLAIGRPADDEKLGRGGRSWRPN